MNLEYEIEYRKLATLDLLEYTDYIERMTFSKEKATKLSNDIVVKILQLSFFPYMYQLFYKNYRFCTINNRRVVYYIDDDKKGVVIYRILSWYQNYQDYL